MDSAVNAELGSIEKLAAALLASSGVSCIWHAYTAAATADQMGEPDLAASLLKVAEAAERQFCSSIAPPKALEVLP
jgi:hypothetical protein